MGTDQRGARGWMEGGITWGFPEVQKSDRIYVKQKHIKSRFISKHLALTSGKNSWEVFIMFEQPEPNDVDNIYFVSIYW